MNRNIVALLLGGSMSLASLAQTQPRTTPAQLQIQGAQRQITTNPRKVSAFNDLAIAYIHRARETANLRNLDDADTALSQGLRIEPKDFQLQKTQIALLLAKHQFIEAKEKATVLNRCTPDDPMLYGYLATAEIALGDYPDAEKAAQWMINMLPNNVPGLLIAAQLRELYGDSEGALQLLNSAYSETSPASPEDLAWIANTIADVQIRSGNINGASAMLERANQLFPDYPYTLENQSRVKLAQHLAKDAVALLQQAIKLNSDSHLLYELANAESSAGQQAEATKTLLTFEKEAATPAAAVEQSQIDLILLRASHPATAAVALALAKQQIALRQDVWTLDAYAWALAANGNSQDAEEQEKKAIDVGIQSAQIFDHAGHIEQQLNHKEQAQKYFELVLKADSSSEYAAEARQSIGAAGMPVEPATPTPQVASSAKEAPKAISSQPVSIQLASVVPFSPVPVALLTSHPTDTDRIISTAQSLVARDPKQAVGYSALGAAHFQRARETGDVSDYQLAEESLTKSLDLDSTNFSADEPLGTLAEVCMGEHRFNDALNYSQKALSLGSGDISSFAIVGDAYADMGEYTKASEAYARLTPRDMTLSPRAAYARDSRVSYLMFIHGDTAAAIALMKTAVSEGVEAQLPSENLAWLYYELGEYYVQSGDASSADQAYVTALTIHPGDYRALASLGKLRANHGHYTEAITLYEKAIAIVPMPIFVAELGDLYAKSGNQAEAKKQYQLVEYIGLLGHINQVLHNRDLALFYADHDIKLTESLELARKEFEVRHDVYTWDALSWSLYKNGQFEEAAKASEKALQFGTRDSLLLFHAGVIAQHDGKLEQARTSLKTALAINPHFHLLYAPDAQQRLASLGTQTASGDQHAH